MIFIAVPDTRLNQSIDNEDIQIEGFSSDIFRSDLPSNSRVPGGVYKENIPIKQTKDLEISQESVVTEITFGRKKVYFIALYRHPHQTGDEFDLFLNRLQLAVDYIKNLKPHCIIINGDFNCRTKQWWPGDIELPEGGALDEFIESNNLSQLIDEPTNIRTTGMSYVDLIITDQPNLFVDFGVHSSLDDHCQHQIIHGKLIISVPIPPPYKTNVWSHVKA